jgi:ABC-type transport system involved in cytochrome bd biosynthesis fused ATPase/permease subunit
MELAFILVVVGLTSAGAYVLGTARYGFSTSGLWLALAKACECVGLTLVFSVVNLAVAMFAILAMRSLSGRFVSVYIASDTTFLVLSWLQALTFQAWREGSQQRYTAESRNSKLLHREP